MKFGKVQMFTDHVVYANGKRVYSSSTRADAEARIEVIKVRAAAGTVSKWKGLNDPTTKWEIKVEQHEGMNVYF